MSHLDDVDEVAAACQRGIAFNSRLLAVQTLP